MEESGPGRAVLVWTTRDGEVSKSEPVPSAEAIEAAATVNGLREVMGDA